MNKSILAIGYYHHNQTIILTGVIMQTITKTNTQYREIPISRLPEHCALRVQVENWVTDKNKATVYVVAKENQLGEWAAFIGYPSLENVRKEYSELEWVVYHCSLISSVQQVERMGDMLDPDTARMLFPEWSYKRYRL